MTDHSHRIGKHETPELLLWLKDRLEYDPETGIITWKERPASDFKQIGRWEWFNRDLKGKVAGGDVSGYWVIFITTPDGKRLRLSGHRIAYGLMKGKWPEHEIDHDNRDGLDNTWNNLRPATSQQNACNKPHRTGTTSIYRGVHWAAKRERWRVVIWKGPKAIHLGTYKNEEIAARAYDAAAIEIHGEFATLNFPEKRAP